jgi:PAS domain-containing protein
LDPQSFICTYASAALLVLDDQARITFANPAAERLFAGTNQALSGRTLDHVLGPGKLVERIKEALKLQNAHAFRITEILTLNPSDKRAVECLVDIVRSSDPEGMNCILQLRTDLPDEAGHEKLDLLATPACFERC